MAGRVTIVAGSEGMSGAALLSAMAASRTGAGLVTLCVPRKIHSVVASSSPPEIMVKPIGRLGDVAALKADAMGVGPGLGTSGSDQALLELFRQFPRPMVIDADGLNRLALHQEMLAHLPPGRVLTPHPGELERLAPAESGSRVAVAERLSERWGVTLLSKGARTVVATPGYPLEINTTGHHGMASGGMGDILTGIITSLMGQGLSTHDAACAGSWLLGRAAELAFIETHSARESVTAVGVAGYLGQALRDLQQQYPG